MTTTSPSDASPRSLPRPPRLLWWGLALLSAFALVAAVIASSLDAPFVQPLDDWWRAIIGVGPDSGAHLWPLPMLFQYLGEGPGQLTLLILVPIALAVVGRWRSAVFFFTMYLLGGLVAQVAKNLVDRPRPSADEVAGLYSPLFAVDHGSLPSGHAVAAATAVVGIAALIPPTRRIAVRVWWVLAPLILLGMAWQRTLINAHWLSDTLLGLTAGAGAALVMWWAFSPWLRRDDGRPVWFLRRPASVQSVSA